MLTNGWNKLHGLAHWMDLELAGANACVRAISFPIAQASAIKFFAHNPNFCVLICFFCNGLHMRVCFVRNAHSICLSFWNCSEGDCIRKITKNSCWCSPLVWLALNSLFQVPPWCASSNKLCSICNTIWWCQRFAEICNSHGSLEA